MTGNGAVWRRISSAELKHAGGGNSEMVLLAVVQHESHVFSDRR